MKHKVKFSIEFECEVDITNDDIAYYAKFAPKDGANIRPSFSKFQMAVTEKVSDVDIPSFTQDMIPNGMTIPEYVDDSFNILEISTVKPFIECTVPEWSLSYLFNGDHSGIDNDEKRKVDTFVKGLPEGGTFVLEDGSESYFSRDNDIDNMAGNVFDVKYYYEEKGE